jgi:hypothetical protein
MNKIAIRVEYKNKTYQSDFDNYDVKEETNLIDLIQKAVGGYLNYLKIPKDNDNIKVYLPKEILKESAIMLVYN